MAYQLVKSLGGAPVFFALVGRQLQRHHRHGQVQGFAQAARVILNQLGGAGRTHQHGLWRKALEGLAGRIFEEFGGIAAQIARLESGVGHRRAFLQALNHRKEQVCIRVALGRMQHVMHAFHGRGNTHGAYMGRSFVSPQGQLHAAAFFRLPGAYGAPAGG